jgi:hypothetical protein
MDLLLEVCRELTVGIMVLLFRITYNRCSGHLMLLYLSPSQVTAWRTIMIFLTVSRLQSKYKGKYGSAMEAFSAAYVNDFIARQMICGVNCDVCKTCLSSQVISTNVFIYFNTCSDTKQPLNCPSGKLVETGGASVIVMESDGRWLT